MVIIPDIAWAILLMVLGCALVVLEVFIPSGGIISILAAVAFIASIVIAFREEPDDRADDGVGLRRGHGVCGADAGGTGVQILAEDADGQGLSGRACRPKRRCCRKIRGGR